MSKRSGLVCLDRWISRRTSVAAFMLVLQVSTHRSTLFKWPTYLQMFLVIKASYYGEEMLERDHIIRFWMVRHGAGRASSPIPTADRNRRCWSHLILLFLLQFWRLLSFVFATPVHFRMEIDVTVVYRSERGTQIMCPVADDFSTVQSTRYRCGYIAWCRKHVLTAQQDQHSHRVCCYNIIRHRISRE